MLYALVFGSVFVFMPDLATCQKARTAAIALIEARTIMGVNRVCPDFEQFICMRRA